MTRSKKSLGKNSNMLCMNPNIFFIEYSFMMTTKKKSITTINASMEPLSTKLTRLPYARMVQNFLLLWLDGSIDEQNNDDCRNSITKLRQVVNTVNTFTDADECIDFITDIKKETIFIIVSGTFTQLLFLSFKIFCK
jgi:hypothetical protein